MDYELNKLIRSEYIVCDLCGSTDHDIVYSKIDHVTGLEFNLVKCACGMAFVNPMPTEETVRFLYPSDYLNEKPHLGKLFENMLRLLPELPDKERHLLDVGCGTGHFMRRAKRAGWDAEGVDFANWGEPKDDLRIHIGNFLLMDLPEENYKVITSWAVLEHVRRPSSFFEKIGKLLSKNGTFIFTVPNIESPGMLLSCDEDVPRHLWLFTPATVAEYLSRNGMEVRTILHNGKIYRSYPFGLIRYGWNVLLRRKKPNCSVYQNKSVSLLRNRSVDVHFRKWISEVLKSLSPWDIFVDGIDLGLGILLANVSKLMKNYGVITVIATKRSHN